MTLILRLLCALLLGAGAEGAKSWGGPRFVKKTVLVTGGDSGIGLAVVEAFYLECARVMLTGYSPQKTQDAADSVRRLHVPAGLCPPGAGPMLESMAGDVGNASFAAALVHRTVEVFGSLDIAVNNAGTKGTLKQVGDPDFVDDLKGQSDPFNVNFYGLTMCMNAEVQQMAASGKGGSIVNVASIVAIIPWNVPMYTASKGAIVSLSRQVAFEYARRGIRVNTVLPGLVNTLMLRTGANQTDPAWLKRKEQMDETIPLGHVAEPWEIAGPILFLSSDMASYVTGTELVVDGLFHNEAPGPFTGSEPHGIESTSPRLIYA